MDLNVAWEREDLFDFAVSQLNESGITDDDLMLKLFNEDLVQEAINGFAFYYPDIEGKKTNFYRIRKKIGDKKYIQEAGTGSRLYFASAILSPGSHKTNGSVFITEGEKKSLALAARFAELEKDAPESSRRCVIGLGGVWNFVDSSSGEKKLLAEFDSISIKGRDVFIVFDSDVHTNKMVFKARETLARLLSSRGAKVKLVDLDTELKAIDDYLVKWGDEWYGRLAEVILKAKVVEPAPVVDYKKLYSQVYTFDEMMDNEFPVPKFFVGTKNFGISAEGFVTIIHGGTNIGKTYFTTQLAYSVATGSGFLHFKTEKGRVLMLQGELPPALYAESRLRPILNAGYKKPSEMLFLNQAFNIAASSKFKETFTESSWSGVDVLSDIIDKHSPNVVIIDPLQSYNNLVESSNDQNREFLKRLKDVAVNKNIAIIAVDHDRKDSKGGLDDMRGAGAKSDLIDCAIGLRKVESQIFMCFDKVRYIDKAIPEPIPINLNNPFFSIMSGI